MKNITIKKNTALIELSIALGRSPDLLIEEILEISNKHGYLVDDICESGRLLVDNMVKDGELRTMEGACILCTGKCGIIVVGKKEFNISELFYKLVLWGKYDCPECGGECEPSPENKEISATYLDPPESDGKEMFVCANCGNEFEIN